MKNEIIHVTKEEAEVIKKNAIQHKDTYFAEIDGSSIKTVADYAQAMAEAFAFPGINTETSYVQAIEAAYGSPRRPESILGWYIDDMTTLIWIEQSDIILIMHNYEQMLADNIELKERIISDFEEIILPWWEGEVVGCMVGGAPKKFLVYLEI